MTGGPEYVQHSEPFCPSAIHFRWVITRSPLHPFSDASGIEFRQVVDGAASKAVRRAHSKNKPVRFVS
jgi:hypothetical protein